VQQKNDSVVWLGQNDRHWRRMTSVQLEETRFQFLFVMLSDRLVAHIDVKTFLRFILFWSLFYVFNFFIFQTFFLFKKTLAKFTAASRLRRSTFKITATK